MLGEPLLVISEVASVLESLRIPYFVGGSVASSFHGVPRATQDVDIVAAVALSHIPKLVEALSPHFYISEPAVQEAVEYTRSFNVIHLATMFKADIFIADSKPYVQSEIQRARQLHMEHDGKTISFQIASPEDALIHKLVWYRLGGETSDRQWQDVLGMVRIQNEGLDRHYIEQWAVDQGVLDLWQRVDADS